MKSFHGKTAAITGAGSGIGRALALALAARGCHLALADVNAPSLAATVEDARRLGVRVTHQRVDVSRLDDLESWAAQVLHDHGRVNLLFNNAGVGQSGTVEATSLDDYRWLIDINLWGVIYGTKVFLPLLKQSGEGHVVNISSIAGIFSQPTMSAYNTSKFAVRGFTESLRQELDLLDCGVSCTCVHPGGIRTDIYRAARLDDSVQDILGAGAERTREVIQRYVMTSPEKAADVILDAVRRDARRVLVGADAKALVFMQQVLPTGYQRVLVALAKYTRRRTQQGRTTAPAPAGTQVSPEPARDTPVAHRRAAAKSASVT